MGKIAGPSFSQITNHDAVNSSERSILLLTASDVRTILTPARCLAALEEMYRNLYRSPTDGGQALGFHTQDGKIHVKAGLSPHTHRYFAAKINANFSNNPVRHSLPTIQGLIVLSSGQNGRPLAILQSGVLTGIRTAAASALAAKNGARKAAKKLALIGCGVQASYQADAMIGVRNISQIIVFDIERKKTNDLAQWIKAKHGIDAVCARSIEEAAGSADICVTCTPSTKAIITASMVPKGCFVAAVGADNPDKQEIAPDVFSGARVIVDDPEQCAASGDLAHARKAGLDVPVVSLAEVASGAAQARRQESEIVLFDSTGVGVQDVAAAATVYELACQMGAGTEIVMEQ